MKQNIAIIWFGLCGNRNFEDDFSLHEAESLPNATVQI